MFVKDTCGARLQKVIDACKESKSSSGHNDCGSYKFCNDNEITESRFYENGGAEKCHKKYADCVFTKMDISETKNTVNADDPTRKTVQTFAVHIATVDYL